MMSEESVQMNVSAKIYRDFHRKNSHLMTFFTKQVEQNKQTNGRLRKFHNHYILKDKHTTFSTLTKKLKLS